MKTKQDLTTAEAARRLGVTLSYAYHLLWAGKLEARRERGRWLVSAEAVEERLRQREARDGSATG